MENPLMGEVLMNGFKPEKLSHLYENLWIEGLAVYVSYVMNPDATNKQILMSDTLVQDATPMIPKLSEELLSKLDSTSLADVQRYFWMQTDSKDIPTRTAYFVGLLVVKHVARRHSLAEMVRLSGPDLRNEVAKALEEMSMSQ
jgi:hypothetical protein